MRMGYVALIASALLVSGCGRPSAVSAPAGALAALCSGTPEGRAASHDAAIAEITAAVRKAGADTGALGQALRDLAANKWAGPGVTRDDVDGDGKTDTVVTFGGCFLPVIVYPGAGEAPAPVLLPTVAGDAPTWTGGGGSRVDRVADVNGDGRPELVVAYQQAGASGGHTYLYIYQWQGGQPAILFHDHLINWVGQNQWTVGDGTVSIQCHVFGPYDHKMTPHQQQTETFRWNPAAAGYELAGRTRTPIETRLQQVGVAERLFQQGKYAEAAREYRQVSAVAASSQTGEEVVDWAAYAHLRLGQIAALAGRRDEALAELAQAEKGAEPMAALAKAFRGAYEGQDAAAGFAALWELTVKTAYTDETRQVRPDTWPFLLDPHTLGARGAMLEAFRQAGRTPSADLPEQREFPETDCLNE